MSYPVVEQQLVDALLNDPTVQDIVGTKIEAGGLLLRNEDMPAISISRISTTRDVASGSYTLDRGYTGFCKARFQFDCWAVDQPTAVALATAVRLVISRLDLTGGGSSKANMVGQERDLPATNMIGQFRRSLDAMIWFQEEGRDG